MEILLRSLTMNFMKTSYIKLTSPLEVNPNKASEYLWPEDAYLRIAAHESIQTLQSNMSTKADEREVKVIYECARRLYVEAVEHIKQRFSFEDKLFTLYEILHPTKALAIGAIGLLQRFYRGIKHRRGIEERKWRNWEVYCFLIFQMWQMTDIFCITWLL